MKQLILFVLILLVDQAYSAAWAQDTRPNIIMIIGG